GGAAADQEGGDQRRQEAAAALANVAEVRRHVGQHRLAVQPRRAPAGRRGRRAALRAIALRGAGVLSSLLSLLLAGLRQATPEPLLGLPLRLLEQRRDELGQR